jgi:hypothetical protein
MVLSEWWRLLRPFTAVRTLCAYKTISGSIALTLENFARETITHVLPALCLLCLENKPASSVKNFLTVRRNSGHCGYRRETEFDIRLESFLCKD